MKATPLKLQRILQRLFAQQAREVASKLNLEQGTLPDMTHWTDVVAEAVKPLLLSMWQQGMVKAGAAIGQSKGASKSLQGALQESTGMATRGLWQAGSLPYSALVNKSRTRMVLVVKAKKSKPAITVDFDLFDPKVLDAVDAAAYAFCRDTMATATGDMRTALDRLRELMRTGLARGDAVQLLAREVRNIFADPARAFRIATTECLTGDCVIKGANIKGVHRRHYSGTLVEAVVEGGQKISGSRNHPVLTQRGWVALGRLVQGDYLVCDTTNVDRSNRSIANEHNEHPPAALNDIFESLSTSAVVERVPMTPYDFHGDGSNGYVNVLTPARLLRHGFVPSRSDLRQQLRFVCADPLGSVCLDSDRNLFGSLDVVDECVDALHIPLWCSKVVKYLLDLPFVHAVLRKRLGDDLLRNAALVHIDDFDADIIRNKNVIVSLFPGTPDPVALRGTQYWQPRSDYDRFNDGRITSKLLGNLLDAVSTVVKQHDIGLLLCREFGNKPVTVEEFAHGGFLRSHGHANLFASPANHSTVAPEQLSDLGEAYSAGVQFRRLVDLRIVENWHGYVFNLDTIDGYYNANGIITQNSSRAMHAGSRMAGVESGVVSSWTWLASSDACEACLELDGKTVKQGEPYAILSGKSSYNVIWHPPAHPHCLTAETPVVVPGLVVAIKARFSGTCYRITLGNGDKFACTPNHMLLTPVGLLCAKDFVKGDHIVNSCLRKRVTSGDPDNYRQPSTAEQTFNAWAVASGVSASRVPVAPEYLHGDAVMCQGDIDVVDAHSLLRRPIDVRSRCGEHVDESFFQCGHRGFDFIGGRQLELARLRHGNTTVGTTTFLNSVGKPDLARLLHRLAALCSVSSRRHEDAVLLAHHRVGDGVLSGFNAKPAQEFQDRPTLTSVLDRQLVSRNALQVLVNNLNARGVVEFETCSHIEPFHYDGFVYDFSTQSSLYTINGIISSNCFCTETENVD